MAIWLIRAGANGRYEQKFLKDSRIYVTLSGLSVNLAILPDHDGLTKAMSPNYPAEKPGRLHSLVNQVWSFAQEIQQGDLVLMLLAQQPAIAIGEITSDYRFEHAAADPFYHWRSVNWLAMQVPRSHFGNDLLISFSSELALGRIDRNNAEQRLAAMRENDWAAEPTVIPDENCDETIAGINLESLAADRIARLISTGFTEADMLRLFESVLNAQGFTTRRAESGTATVILAGRGKLGFDAPRLCAQVLTSATAVGRAAIDELLNTAEKFAAQEALLLSWSGFEPDLQQEADRIFFRLRLWSGKDFLDEIFSCYEQLEDDLKDRLRLKPVWITAVQEP